MDFIIHRKVTICMLFLALSMLGYVSYKQLKAELLPNAELPMLYVQVTSNNDVAPEYLESQAVVPLEGVISTIDGVERTQSTVGTRQGMIQVDFKKNVNFKYTSLKLQQKINEAAQNLPDGIKASVQKVDATRTNNNFMSLQARGSGGVDRVRNLVDEEIKPELEKVDGVAAVNVYGGREKAIEIRLDADACKSLNLTPQRLSSLLSQNSVERTFVGYVDEPTLRYYVHVDANYGKVSEIENIVVAPGPILLKDIATVFFDLKEETSYSRVNGKEAVSISLVNDAQANLIELSHKTLDLIDRLNNELADRDVEIVVQSNNAQTIEDNIDQIADLAIAGGILAIIILWFFLKNIRLVFFITLSIPISIFTAFNFFYAYDITLNSLTLVGMALAVGMLLDNSVVVLENIYRLTAAGLSPEKAVTQGTKEVWRSILAATLTTITVFLPFVYSDNFALKLIGSHIGVSIISTLFVSLVVALLFIPMGTYVILKHNAAKSVFYEKPSINQRPIQIYLVLLKSCLRKPAPIIFGAVILLFTLITLSQVLTVSNQKSVESDRFNLSLSMWGGSSLESSDKMVRTFEERLSSIPEIQDIISQVQEESASMTLVLDKNKMKESGRKMYQIRDEIWQKIGDLGHRVNITMSEGIANTNNEVSSGLNNLMRMMGIGNNRERIVLKGSDYEAMQLVAQDLIYYIGELECVSNTSRSWESNRPEIRLVFDQILLNSYEITRNNISSGLNSLQSNFESGSSLKLDDEEYAIVIREDISEEEEEKRKRTKSVDELKQVQIENANQGLHSLQSLASINYGRGRSQIRRVDREKQIEIYYNFEQNARSSKKLLESYRDEIDQLVANYNLPSGVAIEVVHEEDTLGDFKFLIIAAFILIFMILASVFESLSTPFVLLFTIPLAAIGSLAALLLTGNGLQNTNTMIGFLILLGVVVNNGIILIDYSNILRARGYRRTRALITSGLSRIRPILITSITTIVAMIPLAMGNEEYAGAIGAPFAITVIGGLSFSALLTLIFIPTIANALENALAWYRTQNKKTYFMHILIYLAGIFYIYTEVDGLLWQSLYLILLTVMIPGITFFVKTSLRRAETKLIDPNAEIRIQVSNLVKIYERPNRFVRQWESGIKLRKRLGLTSDYHKLSDFKDTLWQIALFAFAIYFTYFYLENKFWILVLTLVIYGVVKYFKKKVDSYLHHTFGDRPIFNKTDRILYWTAPFVFIYLLYVKLGNPNLTIAITAVWMLMLAISKTSDYLYGNDINIERVEGRHANLKRSWYRLVKSIPVIGKKKRPFKALKGISFDIKTGMFGLLGPNGAGKSTMMRIICGILEQSYGTIWINGLDTNQYREELQGLIGFLPQEFGTYENMTSWEFLDYQAILKGVTDETVRKERLEYVLKAVHMYERKDAKIGSFSGGMKQRIGIALILLHLPRILVVDEPTAGLDPRERIRFRNLLVELSKERIVIFSTHIIEDISSSCNQVVVINKGELKYFGEPNDMENLATGKVWTFNISEKEFEEKLNKQMIVNHIQDGDEIRVRYISIEKPTENAVPAEPNLEDAYLCLLKNM